MAAIPPTTPPTMAPTGVELLLLASLPPFPTPGIVVVAVEALVVEDEEDEDPLGVAVSDKLGGVASSVSSPPRIWHCKMEKTVPGVAVVE